MRVIKPISVENYELSIDEKRHVQIEEQKQKQREVAICLQNFSTDQHNAAKNSRLNRAYCTIHRTKFV